MTDWQKLVYIFWENDSLNKSLHRKKIQNLLKNSDNKEIKNWFAINHNKQLEKKNNNSSYLLFQTNYLTKKSNYFLMENEQNNSGILKVNLENQKVKNFISSLNYKTEYKLKEKIFTQKINEVYNEGKDSGLTWNESIKIINSYRYERDSKLKKDIKMIWKNTNDYKKCPNYKYGCNTKLWKNNKEEYYIEVHHINPFKRKWRRYYFKSNSDLS